MLPPNGPPSFNYRRIHPTLLTQKTSLRHLKLVSLDDVSTFDDFITDPEGFPAAFPKLESLDIGACVLSPVKAPGEEWPISEVLPASLRDLTVQYASWSSLIFHIRKMLAAMKSEGVLPQLKQIRALLKILPFEVHELDASITEEFRGMGVEVQLSARYA